MARIRTIKPEFFRHEDLQDLEMNHAKEYPMLVFAGLWTLSDKEGRFEWRPRQIKLDVLPFLKFDMDQTLKLLADYGFIQKYEVDGKYYGLIPSFQEHQRITGKEAQTPGRYPEPPENQTGNTRETPEQQPRSQEKEKEKEKEKEREGDADKPPRSSQVFKVPSLQEVELYCRERKNNVNPQTFIAFYESNGWKVGRNRMKCWRSAVRTWETRDNGNGSGKVIPGITQQKNPYVNCERCGAEVLEGEFMLSGGVKYCFKCPESKAQAAAEYAKVQGMISNIGRGIN